VRLTVRLALGRRCERCRSPVLRQTVCDVGTRGAAGFRPRNPGTRVPVRRGTNSCTRRRMNSSGL
jgi:hypothetical protein